MKPKELQYQEFHITLVLHYFHKPTYSEDYTKEYCDLVHSQIVNDNVLKNFKNLSAVVGFLNLNCKGKTSSEIETMLNRIYESQTYADVIDIGLRLQCLLANTKFNPEWQKVKKTTLIDRQYFLDNATIDKKNCLVNQSSVSQDRQIIMDESFELKILKILSEIPKEYEQYFLLETYFQCCNYHYNGKEVHKQSIADFVKHRYSVLQKLIMN